MGLGPLPLWLLELRSGIWMVLVPRRLRCLVAGSGCLVSGPRLGGLGSSHWRFDRGRTEFMPEPAGLHECDQRQDVSRWRIRFSKRLDADRTHATLRARA